MESTLKDLKERRSIRAYKPDQIRDEDLQKILEAGTYAPTGMGMQSPKIIVVQDRETRDYLSELNDKYMGSGSDPFYGAPTVLVVLASKERPTCVEDGSLVMGNLMNAAHAIGVGSCWIHRAREVLWYSKVRRESASHGNIYGNAYKTRKSRFCGSGEAWYGR